MHLIIWTNWEKIVKNDLALKNLGQKTNCIQKIFGSKQVLFKKKIFAKQKLRLPKNWDHKFKSKLDQWKQRYCWYVRMLPGYILPWHPKQFSGSKNFMSKNKFYPKNIWSVQVWSKQKLLSTKLRRPWL